MNPDTSIISTIQNLLDIFSIAGNLYIMFCINNDYKWKNINKTINASIQHLPLGIFAVAAKKLEDHQILQMRCVYSTFW